jgi:AcrR family transcriptional regulator
MENSKPPKRKYNSELRHQQARQTRRSILLAAQSLFNERGYTSTTIEAIAQAAGVAPETIYASFGNKLAILKQLLTITLVGDEDPLPFFERPFIQDNLRVRDPALMIHNFAQSIYQIMTRMSPIFALLRTTAQEDPEIAALQKKVLKDRMTGMGLLVNGLRGLSPLRPEIQIDSAITTVWAISSAEVFDLLTREQGWSEEQYVNWLERSVKRLLLPD